MPFRRFFLFGYDFFGLETWQYWVAVSHYVIQVALKVATSVKLIWESASQVPSFMTKINNSIPQFGEKKASILTPYSYQQTPGMTFFWHKEARRKIV